jgi:hypothetical protein
MTSQGLENVLLKGYDDISGKKNGLKMKMASQTKDKKLHYDKCWERGGGTEAADSNFFSSATRLGRQPEAGVEGMGAPPEETDPFQLGRASLSTAILARSSADDPGGKTLATISWVSSSVMPGLDRSASSKAFFSSSMASTLIAGAPLILCICEYRRDSCGKKRMLRFIVANFFCNFRCSFFGVNLNDYFFTVFLLKLKFSKFSVQISMIL